MKNHTRPHAMRARGRSQVRWTEGGITLSLKPSDSASDGTRAPMGNSSVRRSTNPVWDVRRGFSNAHARRLMAMPFNMIVVTTSWAPVFTLRMAGMYAHTMDAATDERSTRGRRMGAGRPLNVIAAPAAVAMATLY